MSEPGKAVFLSYASQDAEAAKRICDALRQAGVEVWFDQSELRGGDTWDAMIRKRIKECTLFLPIISGNTNARAEGYFRLEWKLAVDRSHLMADDAPFLFPIVIGAVTDATARVPDKFRDVQWTRLRLDETPGELAGRVARLLAGGSAMEAGRPRPAERGSDYAKATTDRDGTASPKNAKPAWVRNVSIIGGLAIGLVYAIRPLLLPEKRPEVKPPSVAPAAPAITEARQLAARARAMSLDKFDSSIDDFVAAEGLINRALELDPNDGELWAVSSLLNFSFRSRGFDRAPARNAAARAQAERALKLSPDSIEALFSIGRWQRDNEEPPIAEATLLKVLARDPDHIGALHNLGYLYDRLDRIDEAAVLYAREARNPAAAPLAGFTEFLMYFRRARFAEAEQAVRKSIAAEPSANSQSGLAMLLLTWKGDAEAAALALATGPATIRREHRPIWIAAFTHLCRRKPDEALRVLDRLSDEFILDNWYTGPKNYFIGLAHAQAGREAAARVAWEAGLTLVDQRLRSTPADYDLRLARGELLAWLGREAEALEEVRTIEQLTSRERNWISSPVRIHAALGRADAALRLIEQNLQFSREHRSLGWPLSPALLRIDPRWDKIRGDPRFQALCAEPVLKTEDRGQKTEVSAPIDQKSVAVLAFANLSDDKGNEYFSDGISEELLNVLAKVPGLKVSARTSAFYFKGKEVPIPEIAKQLGVAYVVEGSVRKQGDKVRITAQLIKAADGFHVWSDTFTRDLKDIFAVQDEIAGLIARNLQLKMGVSSAAPVMDAEVLPLYYSALQAWNLRTLEGMDRAETLLNDALARAPDFARGHAALAMVWVIRGELRDSLSAFGQRDGPESAMINAKVQQALKLDPNCAEAYAALGLYSWDTWQWTPGIAALRQAIALNPNLAFAHQWLGRILVNQGFLDEGLAELGKAAALDPLSPRILDNNGRALLLAGRPREAENFADRALALQPGSIQALAVKGSAQQDLGNMTVAKEIARALPSGRSLVSVYKVRILAGSGQLQEVEAMLPDLTRANLMARVAALVALGRREEALGALDASWVTANRTDQLLFEPSLNPIRDDSRFQQMLATLDLTEAHARAQAWRAAHPPEKAK